MGSDRRPLPTPTREVGSTSFGIVRNISETGLRVAVSNIRSTMLELSSCL